MLYNNENELEDELLPEYDFSKMTGGLKGKYAERSLAGTNLVLLELDVASSFPTESSKERAPKQKHASKEERSSPTQVQNNSQ